MNIDITRLKSGLIEYIDINEILDTSKIDLTSTDLLDLKDVHVSGTITKDSLDQYLLNLNIEGLMVLPCSITLKPVDYHFSIEISDNIEEMFKEIGEIDKKIENTIDIFPIIWENILMEIPIKVTSPDAVKENLHGDGWQLVTDEEEVKEYNAFDKLKDLL